MNEIKSKEEINMGLNSCAENYKNLSASEYLYNLVLQKHKTKKLSDLLESDEFYKLLYATLDSWNMNSRGAKLKDFEEFVENIKKQKTIFLELEKYNLLKITAEDLNQLIDGKIMELYKKISILKSRQTKCDVKDPLVVNSKLFHFILPKLCPPMDREYTMKFFYNNTDTNFKRYKEVFLKNKVFLDRFNLDGIPKEYENKFSYPLYSTKILDNVIIGLRKLEEKN